MRRKYYAALCAPILLAGVGAWGATVYDNGGPNQQSGNEAAQWLQTEDFSLAAPTALASANFWTLETSPGWDGTLDWYLFANNAGQPGAMLANGAGMNVNKVATGLTALGGAYTEYEYSFNFGGTPVLAAGTTYFFGIHLAADYSTRDDVYWETTSQGPGDGEESLGGTLNNWSDNGQEHAFNLQGAVPDATGTAPLLGAAFVGLCALSRRFKR